jgi:hypothetical protein
VEKLRLIELRKLKTHLDCARTSETVRTLATRDLTVTVVVGSSVQENGIAESTHPSRTNVMAMYVNSTRNRVAHYLGYAWCDWVLDVTNE